jgi:hypothetical protein
VITRPEATTATMVHRSKLNRVAGRPKKLVLHVPPKSRAPGTLDVAESPGEGRPRHRGPPPPKGNVRGVRVFTGRLPTTIPLRDHVRSDEERVLRSLAGCVSVLSRFKSNSPGEHEGSAQRKPQGPARWGRVAGCGYMHAAAPAASWTARDTCAGAALLATFLPELRDLASLLLSHVEFGWPPGLCFE